MIYMVSKFELDRVLKLEVRAQCHSDSLFGNIVQGEN